MCRAGLRRRDESGYLYAMKTRVLLAVAALSGLLAAGCQRAATASDGPAPASVASQQKDREPAWSYHGERGPQVWADLDPAWEVARTGREQSPVNIAGTVSATLQAVPFSYATSPVRLVNTGQMLEVHCDPGSSIRLDGIRYQLEKLAFHAPSEHTVGGRQAPMEMQLVHRDDRGDVAIIAIFIEQGSAHETIDAMWQRLSPAAGPPVAIDEVQLERLLPRSRRYYRYRGSLTHPPCTEGVTWLVMQEPIRISEQQLDRFRSIHDRTSRPVQPLHDRQILAGQ